MSSIVLDSIWLSLVRINKLIGLLILLSLIFKSIGLIFLFSISLTNLRILLLSNRLIKNKRLFVGGCSPFDILDHVLVFDEALL
jgi:hypothetical protein